MQNIDTKMHYLPCKLMAAEKFVAKELKYGAFLYRGQSLEGQLSKPWAHLQQK